MESALRIARPVRNLARSAALYTEGLGCVVLGSFRDHEGFDGVILGRVGLPYHFELTCRPHAPVTPAPTHEDLLVFYIPERLAWQEACARMLGAGFTPVAPLNPYWARQGASFEDPDGYRTVLQNAAWTNTAPG